MDLNVDSPVIDVNLFLVERPVHESNLQERSMSRYDDNIDKVSPHTYERTEAINHEKLLHRLTVLLF